MGRFGRTPQLLYRTKRRRVFEEFANWPDGPRDILRFTRRYGPLEQRALPDGLFRFRLEEWRQNREGFRWLWSLVQSGQSLGALARPSSEGWQPLIEFRPDGTSRLPVDEHDEWVYARAALRYEPANLWRLLVFDLLSTPKERLRRCARADCQNPYFVARHLKKRYCSEPCAATARAGWKRNWWTQHGKQWREKRQKQQQKRR